MQKVGRIPPAQPVRPASRPADPRDERRDPPASEAGVVADRETPDGPADQSRGRRPGALVDDYA